MTFVSITCPYCGHINSIQVDANDFFTNGIISCDQETGGCDNLFAYHVYFKPAAQVSKVDFQPVEKP